jgi:hypothetical protein
MAKRFLAAAVGLGVAGTLPAEPIQAPLFTTPLSKPADEPRPAGPPVAPGGNLIPQVPAPATDFLAMPKPVLPPAQVAEPAPPAKPVEPARPVSRTKPDSPLRPADPGFSVNSTGLGDPAAPAAPPAPGVDPMTTPSSAAVLTAALGLALAAAPSAPAQDADVGKIKAATDDIKADLAALKAVVNGNAAAGVRDGMIDRLKALDDQMKRLEVKMAQIDDKLSQMMTRTSASSPVAGGAIPGVPQPMAGPLGAAKGTVRLVNEYSVEVSLLLNGKAYRLGAGETRNVDAPAGDYTYELLQSGAQSKPVTSQIKDGETVTLRIH